MSILYRFGRNHSRRDGQGAGRRMATRLLLILLLITALAGFLGVGEPLPGAAAAPNLEKVPGHRVERFELGLKKAVAEVQPILERYGYPAVFFMILVEGVGVPAPGQTLLMAAGLEAARGHLNLIWVLICAGAGAILGNSLGYLLGRWGGRPLLAKFKVRKDHLSRLEGKFRRYGGSVVLVARFFDGLRQLNGIVAGVLAMPWWTFTAFNVLGALLWTLVWGLGVFWLDKEMGSVHRTFRQIEPVAVVLTLLGLLAVLVYLFRRGQGQKPK